MTVTIIDYGMGNLYSAQKACEFCGHKTHLSSEPKDILNADKLILPGVGAFGQAMEQLRSCGLEDAIKTAVSDGIPLLGICLGMQLLFKSSEESSEDIKGLALLDGTIERFKDFPNEDGKRWKVPHMGWNSIRPRKDSKLFSGVGEGEHVYFVHSFRAGDVDAPYAAALTSYGYDFVSAIEQGNLFATQFHPEKSGKIGMKILNNFLNI